MTTRGLERFQFRPWGLAGGAPGQLARATLNPGTPGERELGKFDVLRLRPGDVVEFQTASGGGYGDPLEREPAAVLEDVEAGMLQPEDARGQYGVEVAEGSAAAAPQRDRAHSAPRPLFDGGPERARYEAVWTDAVQTALLQAVLQHPGPLRAFLRGEAIERLRVAAAAGERLTEALVQRAVEDVLARLGTGPDELPAAAQDELPAVAADGQDPLETRPASTQRSADTPIHPPAAAPPGDRYLP